MEEAEESGGGFCTRVGAKCGRWNPTPEQVKVLTDLFRSGLRTPSTDQIQKISAYLSSFGKIESKNVFYWFQNHKARERNHKKRRRPTPDQHPTPRALPALDSKRSDACSRSYCMSVEEEMVISERRERANETLELFPLSSYTMEAEKVMRTARNQHKGVLPFFKTGRDIPPLDLRLSFM